MATLDWKLKHATETTAAVFVRSDTTGTVTLTANGVTYTSSVDTSVNDGTAVITATGLSADKSYPFSMTLSDATETGNLRTMPQAGSAYNVLWFSCLDNSIPKDPTGLRRAVSTWGVRAAFDQGDTPYMELATNAYGVTAPDMDSAANAVVASNYYAHHRAMLRWPSLKYIGQRVPYYDSHDDDHGWPGDNWDHTVTQANAHGSVCTTQADVDNVFNIGNLAAIVYSAGNPANTDGDASAEFPKYAGVSTVDGSTPESNYSVRYFRHTIGDVEYFHLDTVSHNSPEPLGTYPDSGTTANPNKTLLGATQRAWLKAHLLSSTATFKVIVSPKKTYATAGVDNLNTFGQYQKERDNILDYIDTNGITGVLWIVGDRHTPEVIASWKSAGDTYDHVCVNASPVTQPINAVQGTPGTYTRVLAPAWDRVFGVLEVHGSAYIKINIVDMSGIVQWSGKVLAGTNYLTYDTGGIGV